MRSRDARCARSSTTGMVVLAVLLALVAPARAAGPALTGTRPPQVTGTAVYAGHLHSGPGRWDPATVTVRYQWLRGRTPIPGATAASYVPGLADLGHVLRSRVTATDRAGDTATATSAPTVLVTRAIFRNSAIPRALGTARYTHVLRATPGRWVPAPTGVAYQWLLDGRAIDGATDRHYRPAPGDVGHRLGVRTVVSRRGYHDAVATSVPVRVRDHEDVRRTVTYHVETRGHIVTSVARFARLAQATYDDPRGWRGAGIAFTRVAHGGDFTLVLAEASQVPSFSSSCTAEYSCRVGRYVIINQTRFLYASPPWNAAGGTVADYDHLVFDHETGHWLGLHHSGCGGPGQLAPVMMQQSKGLDGCRFNPWPLAHEWHLVGG